MISLAMSEINGKFRLVKNENFKELLIALGVEECKAEITDKMRLINEFSIEDSVLHMKVIDGSKTLMSVEFILGQEVDEPAPRGNFVKSIATINKNVILIESKGLGVETSRTYTFSEWGCVLAVKCVNKPEAPVALKIYKRI